MQNIIENYRKMHQKLLPEINANIEKYRKGTFKINVIDGDGKPVNATVKLEQKNHAFDFGTSALMIGNMGDKEKQYRDAVSNLFNFITTTFCWGVMETEPGKFRFSEGSEEIYRRPPSDRVLEFAKKNGMKAKGQPLFCGRWCPEWLPKDYETLKLAWLNFVKEVAKRYDGQFSVFDVVNESYQTDADGSWENMLWIPEKIEDFVEWLLVNAGKEFSDKCVLERNEATHVNFGEYAEKYYQENKKLLEKGVRLDAIGFQFHFFCGDSCTMSHLNGKASLENIYATYHKMSTLGVPMYITEITIPTIYRGLSRSEGENLQAEIIENMYRLWFSIPKMKGIVYWNLKDGDTWVNEDRCMGCLLDENMRKKKSYYALEHLIKREWNTCEKAQTDDGGVFEFSGFYGDYDITVKTNDGTIKKLTERLDIDGKTLNVII